jgi:hypothetical protein
MNANFTVLAAKEGTWRRVVVRLGGMLRRSFTEPGRGWARSFLISCRQLLGLFLRKFSCSPPADKLAIRNKATKSGNHGRGRCAARQRRFASASTTIIGST